MIALYDTLNDHGVCCCLRSAASIGVSCANHRVCIPHDPVQLGLVPLVRRPPPNQSLNLRPVLQVGQGLDIIARNEVQKDWDALMWKYDQANAKLKEYITSESFVKANGQVEMLKTLQDGPIQFDLNKYSGLTADTFSRKRTANSC